MLMMLKVRIRQGRLAGHLQQARGLDKLCADDVESKDQAGQTSWAASTGRGLDESCADDVEIKDQAEQTSWADSTGQRVG